MISRIYNLQFLIIKWLETVDITSVTFLSQATSTYLQEVARPCTLRIILFIPFSYSNLSIVVRKLCNALISKQPSRC